MPGGGGGRKSGKTYKDVITHEYVHLTQDINQYIYIEEACAEIVEYEFFNQPCNGYSDMVKRVKTLMEIIGPQPIIDCNFKGDTRSFEESIRKYLSEEDTYRLLVLFTTTAQDQYKTSDSANANNKEIDKLLSKMYTNKTGKSITEDKMIMKINSGSTNSRIYFNPNHEDYDKDYQIVTERKLEEEANIDDVKKSGMVEFYTVTTKEAKKTGDTTKYTYETTQTTDFDSITTDKLSYVIINFKDGRTGNLTFNKETNEWNKVQIYGKTIIEYEPSIAKKFPDQAQQKIEIHRSNAYDVKQEKSM